MGRNGKVRISVVVTLVGLALVIVGGAWAYTLRNGERLATVETRVDHLEETAKQGNAEIKSGFKGIIEALKKE